MNELAMIQEHPSAAYLDVATAAHNLDALKAKRNLLIEAMKDVLQKDIDFGVIPGTTKPTLLKAGAENLSFLFGLRPTFEMMDSIEDWDKGLFYYRYRCTLNGGDGRIVTNSEGSCNSRETKYRYRNAKQKCPECGADTISKSKYPPRNSPGAPKGWWCRSCKTDYAHNDKRITEQKLGRVENTEPFELINTLQKMAQKRALVAAVLIGTGASQFFTQDVEDMNTIVIDALVREVETPKVQASNDIDLDFDSVPPIDPGATAPPEQGDFLTIAIVGATKTKDGTKTYLGLWEAGKDYPSLRLWGGRDKFLENCPWAGDSMTKDGLGDVNTRYEFNARVYYEENDRGYKDVKRIERIT